MSPSEPPRPYLFSMHPWPLGGLKYEITNHQSQPSLRAAALQGTTTVPSYRAPRNPGAREAQNWGAWLYIHLALSKTTAQGPITSMEVGSRDLWVLRRPDSLISHITWSQVWIYLGFVSPSLMDTRALCGALVLLSSSDNSFFCDVPERST